MIFKHLSRWRRWTIPSVIALLIPMSGWAVEEKEVLTYYVISKQARPLQIETKGTMHSGVVSDIVFAMLADTPVELKVVTLPFKRMKQEMRLGKHKNWISYGSPAWQSKASNDKQESSLLEPLLSARHVMITLPDINAPTSSAAAISGGSLITLHGFSYPGLETYLTERSIQRMQVKDHRAAFHSVLAGRGLGFVGIDFKIGYNLKAEQLGRDTFKHHDFSHVLAPYDIHLSHSLSLSPKLKALLQKRLNDLRQQGFIEETIEKYTGARL